MDINYIRGLVVSRLEVVEFDKPTINKVIEEVIEAIDNNTTPQNTSTISQADFDVVCEVVNTYLEPAPEQQTENTIAEPLKNVFNAMLQPLTDRIAQEYPDATPEEKERIKKDFIVHYLNN